MSKKVWYAPNKLEAYGEEEIKAVEQCLRDGWLAGFGPRSIEFEEKISKEFGRSLGLDPNRCYNDYKIMAKKESSRSDGVQAIGIMTPSGDHYKIAREFIKNNVHIICDKPLTSKVEDALALEKLVNKNKIVFALKHNY